MFLYRSFCVISVILYTVKCTIMKSPSVEENFKQCLISRPQVSSFGYCLGVGAMNKLQSLDNNPEFDIVDGVTLTRDSQEFRETFNFAERDPTDFRTVFDTMSHVLTKRSMKWDMSFLYPGLALRMAPSLNTAGVLEFVLDPHRQAINQHSLKEAGTGQILARQFIVPFLLGFKFNVVTLIPLIFGLLALVAKKAVFLSKLALIVTSALGLGTLLLGTGGNGYPSHHHHQQHNGFRPGFVSQGGSPYRFPDMDYIDPIYREKTSLAEDQLLLHGNIKLQNAFPREEKTNGRNFAWDEDEKIKKT